MSNKFKKQPDIDLAESVQDGKCNGSKLIRGQDAIDAINSYFGFNIEEEYGSAVQEVINGLPSVQPEIIRCKECQYGEQDDGMWYCRSLGCQIGDVDGNGYCSDAERRTDEQVN